MLEKNKEILALWSELFVAQPMAVRKVERIMGDKAPLGLDEYDLLLVISRHKGNKCRFAVLAEETLYTKSGVSRVSKRMLEKGYLIKEGCEEDKRGAYAVLTNDGIEALKETWNFYSEAVLEVLSPCFDTESAIQLRQLLGGLVDQLRDDALIPMPRRIS
jgi:DNA-binding MarR family transcriptional regulator